MFGNRPIGKGWVLDPEAEKDGQIRLPTFIRAIARSRPPASPAGLNDWSGGRRMNEAPTSVPHA